MMITHMLRAMLITTSVATLCTVPISSARAGNGVPDYIVEYRGQPAIAVFEDVNQSYAIGCPAVRSLWSKVNVQRAVTSAIFNQIIAINPIVADLPCNGRVRAYAPKGEPGALVIPYRDGSFCRHYVNSTAFFAATRAGGEIPISAQDFRSEFACRGTDFRVAR
jgi:hypothetical protein